MLLADKVVLITGASRGIGAACIDSFRRRGALLSLTARSSIHDREALVTEGDLTRPAVRRSIVERTVDRYGRIDVLINNAGFGSYHPSETADPRPMFELNFFAAVGLIQLVLPHMRRQRSGAIVNVGSVAGEMPLPWMTFYSASKSALGGLSTGLRRELRRDGIHVMHVSPGYVKTPFQEHAEGTAPARVINARRFAITAEQCAEAIAKGLEREARTVVAPPIFRVLIALDRFLPAVLDSRLSAMLE